MVSHPETGWDSPIGLDRDRGRDNLYLYQGSTTVGIAAAVSEADKVAKMSRLWHMRLGHSGEKSL